MNIKLYIVQHYDDKFDCIQNILYSVLEKIISLPQLILFGTWNFKFKESEIENGHIGNCLLSSKLETIIVCKEFYGVKFQPLPMDSRAIDTIIECLKSKEFILIKVDTKQIPWKLNQDIFIEEHYCLIQGIDTVCEALYVMDSYALDYNESVILLSKLSMIKKMWRIDLTNLYDCFLSPKEIIKMLLKRIQSDLVLEQEYKYLNYLKKHTIDMRKETEGYEGKTAFCPFMWNLYNLSTGRYQTSRLIDGLLQTEYNYALEQVYNGLTELSKSWEDIRNLFVKYTIRGSKVVYQRIIVHTEEIIEKEKQVFNQMGEYINEEKK